MNEPLTLVAHAGDKGRAFRNRVFLFKAKHQKHSTKKLLANIIPTHENLIYEVCMCVCVCVCVHVLVGANVAAGSICNHTLKYDYKNTVVGFMYT